MAYTLNPIVSAFESWGKKNPSYEKHFEESLIKPLTDFGKGTNEASDAKGKVLGAGYEALIMAFFIGLYSNKRLPLSKDAGIKDLGQPIQYWGNIESRKGRKAYPKLREYMFIALVSKTPEIDWLELEKGNRTINETVNLLMSTMEEYINYGLSVMEEKIKADETYFYNNSAFLDIFRQLTAPEDAEAPAAESDNEPEPLD